jgi:hypothetical protein
VPEGFAELEKSRSLGAEQKMFNRDVSLFDRSGKKIRAATQSEIKAWVDGGLARKDGRYRGRWLSASPVPSSSSESVSSTHHEIGLSGVIGAYAAAAVRNGEAWALAMLRDISRKTN